MSRAKRKKIKRDFISLDDYAREAKEKGLTYGQLQAMEILGKMKESKNDRKAVQNDAVQGAGQTEKTVG